MPDGQAATAQVDQELMDRCVRECYECVRLISKCLDLCLESDQIDKLRACIRLCMDCADLCVGCAEPVGEQPDILQKYPVLATPGVVVNGRLVASGALSERALRKKIEDALPR